MLNSWKPDCEHTDRHCTCEQRKGLIVLKVLGIRVELERVVGIHRIEDGIVQIRHALRHGHGLVGAGRPALHLRQQQRGQRFVLRGQVRIGEIRVEQEDIGGRRLQVRHDGTKDGRSKRQAAILNGTQHTQQRSHIGRHVERGAFASKQRRHWLSVDGRHIHAAVKEGVDDGEVVVDDTLQLLLKTTLNHRRWIRVAGVILLTPGGKFATACIL